MHRTSRRSDGAHFFRDRGGRVYDLISELRAAPNRGRDISLLRQVFVNLLSNAVKYSRRSPSPQVEIDAVERASDEWTIFVRDNGVDFDVSQADKLFTAFQRLHSSPEFEGTGIGLVNVRRIMPRHGGRVWAESRRTTARPST